MTWLSDLFAWLLSSLGVDLSIPLGASLHFFCCDTVKIAILLVAVIFHINYVQSYYPPERTQRIPGGLCGTGAYVAGALMGTVTPFCSCSSIPIFIGFVKAGLPVGVTFAFLISSSMVDLASLILLASVFNWRMALAYVVLGLVVAIAGGMLMDRMGLEGEVPTFVREGGVTEGVEVAYVTDMAQIVAAGIMSMPALAVDGKVVSSGKVLTVKEAAELLA